MIKLTTIKNSLHEDFNKVKVLVLNYYDQILTLLNWEKTEVELERSNYGWQITMYIHQDRTEVK